MTAMLRDMRSKFCVNKTSLKKLNSLILQFSWNVE